MNIQDKAVLVGLSIGFPGNTRKDQAFTNRVQSQNNLGGKSGRWVKQLYPSESYEKLTQMGTTIRAYHAEHTLLWPDDGWALLPMSTHQQYTEDMREFRRKFEGVRDEFLASYDDYVDWARTEHNGTFRMEEYPGAEAIRGKFKFSLKYRPIPASDQFATQIQGLLGPDAAELDNAVSQAFADAKKDLWLRLLEPVRHMVQFIRESETKERTRWCDSLVDNVKSIVALIPALNVSGDQALESFRVEIQAAIKSLSSDTLKVSKGARDDLVKQADDILARMSGYVS